MRSQLFTIQQYVLNVGPGKNCVKKIWRQGVKMKLVLRCLAILLAGKSHIARIYSTAVTISFYP